jgi:hypothetical protein
MRIDDPLAQQRIDLTPLMSVHLNPGESRTGTN